MIEPCRTCASSSPRTRRGKPAHGGVPGIIRAHSLDAGLLPRVFAFSSGVNQGGPLSWPERELIAATTSRLNQCFY